jgi:penicillin-binding protein 1A
LTAAYAALAAGRYPVVPHGLAEKPAEENFLGSLLHRGGGNGGRSDPAFADMRELLGYAVAKGTGHTAALPIVTFGKTGTTQDSRDALFIGFAGDLVVGIWVGNDDNRPMQGVSGGGLPARIWRSFMVQALNLPPPQRPAKPRLEENGDDEDDLGNIVARVLRRIGVTG